MHLSQPLLITFVLHKIVAVFHEKNMTKSLHYFYLEFKKEED